MKISEIYSQYSIPLNLQSHMLKVAALGSLICDRFEDHVIDKDLVVKTLLLHDMGNILKFNFERLDLFEEADKKNVEKYKHAQKEYREKYGSDPDVATLQIIKEITSDKEVATLCEEAHWLNLANFINSDRWDVMVCTYSDMRTGPFGLLTITERVNDLKKRRPEESEDLDILLEQGFIVEKQLNVATQNKLSEITSELVEHVAEKLRKTEI